MRELWPASGFRELQRDAHGWLAPTDAYLRLFLALPELAIVAESCAAERRLRAALEATPARRVDPAELAALADADARDNYRHFLRFRDALLAAGSLEAWYLGVFRAGTIDVPPLFVDRVAAAIVRNIVDGWEDALALRAAEMLFRVQRIAVHEGRVLAADRDALDLVAPAAGPGTIVDRLLAGSAAPASVELEVLGEANAAHYLAQSDGRTFALDLSHVFASDLGHGLVITLARADSGLKALARVLERWVAHFLGVAVAIEPRSRIDDPAWAWHVGLDVESTALLNDLYRHGASESVDTSRLIGLFRLDFADPQDMGADLAGKPVYLGLAMTAEHTLKLKPQNLLVNLPLAGPV
ncbi:MAG: DUF6352 family protein [Caldimonas sp.]